MRNKYRRHSGFTFLEIMFVVVIIGILLALVGPRMVGKTKKARIAATRTQMRNIETALKNFELDNGYFPENLEGLIEKPSDAEDNMWDGPYLDADKIPTDSWNQEFMYKAPGDHRRDSFDIASKGPDRQENTEDDIKNWTSD